MYRLNRPVLADLLVEKPSSRATLFVKIFLSFRWLAVTDAIGTSLAAPYLASFSRAAACKQLSETGMWFTVNHIKRNMRNFTCE